SMCGYCLMKPSGIITLLTDFGIRDPFVGVVKGVLLSRCPTAQLVDLTHGITPQQVDEAGFWLSSCYRWFPPGTVHLAVVDPGVGGARSGLVVGTREHVFVGPDNGLFGRVLAAGTRARAHQIELERLRLPRPSCTFHGRDLFAPVAAEIVAGRLSWDAVGPIRGDWVALPDSRPRRLGAEVHGVVVTVDHFGNLITDIEEHLLAGIDRPIVLVAGVACPLRTTYSDVAPGELVAMPGSFGTLEVARREGSAALALGLGRGTTVIVRGGRD
ncbi:S-adenosyl-l-methionine hydroxide adenosyltransferase family protein, partial [Myxococcota bacterium]